VDRVFVDEGDSAFLGLEACAARYRVAHATGEGPGAVPGIEHARELFRALSIDPTRRRPSSEALLRRALQGKPLPRINTIVDVGNWCSLDFLLPLGLYDRDRLAGAVRLRRGEASESYPAIGEKVMNLEGRYCLADDEGPFGSPMTDSLRTAASTETTSIAIFVYAPRVYEPARLRRHAETLAARVVEHCAGEGSRVTVISGAGA